MVIIWGLLRALARSLWGARLFLPFWAYHPPPFPALQVWAQAPRKTDDYLAFRAANDLRAPYR